MRDDRTVLQPEAMPNFVETDYVREITFRALTYLAAGYAVHFRGPAGTGKTTIAKHVAAQLGRPMVLLQGDDEFNSSSLTGGEYGYRSREVVDNFISSVLKKEKEMVKYWVDNRLTVACRHGFTLLYDEFTRSRPEANNVLLSVLQDRLLTLPTSRHGEDPYIQVHPDFAAIFTSNPEEYAGIHKTQDALRDRMVTIDLAYFDYETEVGITVAKSGCLPADAEFIVQIVRGLRESGVCEFSPTVRGGIMVAKAMQVLRLRPSDHRERFTIICEDVLGSEASRVGAGERQRQIKATLRELIDHQFRVHHVGEKKVLVKAYAKVG